MFVSGAYRAFQEQESRGYRWLQSGVPPSVVSRRGSTGVTYATRTNTVLTAPTGIKNGDLLVILFGIGAATPPTPTAPAGFTVVPGPTFPITDTQLSFSVKSWVWYKIASGESGNYTVTHASASSQGWIGAYSGADTTTPFSPNVTSSTATGNTSTATGLTTPRSGCMILFLEHDWGDNTNNLTGPAGTTPTFIKELGPTTTAGIMYVADGMLTAAGATGDKSITNNSGISPASPSTSYLVSIQPAFATAKPTPSKTTQEWPSHPGPMILGPVGKGAAQAILPTAYRTSKTALAWPHIGGSLFQSGYAQSQRGGGFGAAQARTPAQSNFAQTDPTDAYWPFIGAGYARIAAILRYTSAQTGPGLPATVVPQEWPRDWAGYRQIAGPVGYGAGQAAKPLQAEMVSNVQEQPPNPGPSVIGPVGYGAAQATVRLHAAIARTTQEQPWHPGPYLAGSIGLSARRPLQSAASKSVQEQPWHPSPYLIGSIGFTAPSAPLLQSTVAKNAQEQPWHPLPYLIGSVGFSVTLPLHSATSKTTQEQPWHPLGYLSGVVGFGASQSALPIQSTVSKTTQEQPWHPAPYMIGSIGFSASLPLRSAASRTSQEQPWHPLGFLAGAVGFGSAQASLSLLSATSKTTQEQPWHPLGYSLGSIGFSVTLPLRSATSKTTQEQPWHPGPYLIGSIGFSASLPLQAALSRTVQEQPWHPGPYISGVVGYGAVQKILPLQASRVATAQEWPGEWKVGYRLTVGTVGKGAAQAIRPIQATKSVTQQEWPRDWAGYRMSFASARYNFVNAPILQSTILRTTQEQPWHPLPYLVGSVGFSATLPLQSIAVKLVQEQPWHPLGSLIGPVGFGASQFALSLQSVVSRTIQEQPWHPNSYLIGATGFSATLPLQATGAITTQEQPWHPSPYLISSTGLNAELTLKSTMVRTVQELPWHPGPYLIGPVGFGASQASEPLQSAEINASQEWPRDWIDHRSIVAASIFGGQPMLQSATIVAPQEFPYHPTPWTTGELLYYIFPAAPGVAVTDIWMASSVIISPLLLNSSITNPFCSESIATGSIGLATGARRAPGSS